MIGWFCWSMELLVFDWLILFVSGVACIWLFDFAGQWSCLYLIGLILVVIGVACNWMLDFVCLWSCLFLIGWFCLSAEMLVFDWLILFVSGVALLWLVDFVCQQSYLSLIGWFCCFSGVVCDWLLCELVRRAACGPLCGVWQLREATLSPRRVRRKQLLCSPGSRYPQMPGRCF